MQKSGRKESDFIKKEKRALKEKRRAKVLAQQKDLILKLQVGYSNRHRAAKARPKKNRELLLSLKEEVL